MRQEFPHLMTLDLDPSTVPTDPRERLHLDPQPSLLGDHQPSLLGSLVAFLERVGPLRRAQVILDRVRSAVDRLAGVTEPGLDEHRSWALLAPSGCAARSRRSETTSPGLDRLAAGPGASSTDH